MIVVLNRLRHSVEDMDVIMSSVYSVASLWQSDYNSWTLRK